MNENSDFNLLTPEQAAGLVHDALQGDSDKPEGLAHLLARLRSFVEQGAQSARVLDAIDFLLIACYDHSAARHKAAGAYFKAVAEGRDPSAGPSEQGDTLRVKNLVVESLTLVNSRGERRGELLTARTATAPPSSSLTGREGRRRDDRREGRRSRLHGAGCRQ